MKIIKDPIPFRFNDPKLCELAMTSKPTRLMELSIPAWLPDGSVNPEWENARYEVVYVFNEKLVFPKSKKKKKQK